MLDVHNGGAIGVYIGNGISELSFGKTYVCNLYEAAMAFEMNSKTMETYPREK